jgi:predicted N-acetyltransferase YhbS
VSEVGLRLATANDLVAIAELHVHSWREHYRGVYSDAFLDRDADGDRLETWRRRLTGPVADSFTIVAELNGVIVGFAHVVLDADPTRGPVLQNLHVRTEVQHQEIGSRLVAEVLRTVPRLHVWVREDNAGAREFYEARGGRPAGRALGGPFADGSRAPVLCFAWSGSRSR